MYIKKTNIDGRHREKITQNILAVGESKYTKKKFRTTTTTKIKQKKVLESLIYTL